MTRKQSTAPARWVVQATWTERTTAKWQQAEVEIERSNRPVAVRNEREGEAMGARWWGDQFNIPGFIPAPSRRLVRVELIDRRSGVHEPRLIPEPLGMVVPAPESAARSLADVRAENAERLAATIETTNPSEGDNHE